MGIGPLLKTWRDQRRLSQLDLALEAGVSTRHLSFVETGRSRPSEQMVLHLAEQLDVPLRERNRLLLAAGYAPSLLAAAAASELGPVKDALDQLLASHEPFPAIVVDRAWNLVAANAAIAMLTAGAAPHLLEPPVNALRLALHPDGHGAADRATSASGARTCCAISRRRSTRPATTSSRPCSRNCRRYPGRAGRAGRARGLRPAAHRGPTA